MTRKRPTLGHLGLQCIEAGPRVGTPQHNAVALTPRPHRPCQHQRLHLVRTVAQSGTSVVQHGTMRFIRCTMQSLKRNRVTLNSHYGGQSVSWFISFILVHDCVAALHTKLKHNDTDTRLSNDPTNSLASTLYQRQRVFCIYII